MSARSFWATTALSRASYVRLDRSSARLIDIGTAAGNVVLSSTRIPQAVSDFVVGFISDNGYDSEGIERAIRGFSSIEKSAVRDYCAMRLEKE